MSDKTLVAALAYLAAGFSVFPRLPGSKLPAIKWKRFQTERASATEIWT